MWSDLIPVKFGSGTHTVCRYSLRLSRGYFLVEDEHKYPGEELSATRNAEKERGTYQILSIYPELLEGSMSSNFRGQGSDTS